MNWNIFGAFKVMGAVVAVAFATWITGAVAAENDNEANTEVLAENGTWGYNGPHAVVADGALFWTYIDSDGMVWAASYDLETGHIERNGVWDTASDLHQASSLCVRPDGRIQVFVNKGGVYTDNKIFWKVSEEAGDVTAFGEVQESQEVEAAQGRQFYPLVHGAAGHVYLVLNAMVDGNRRIGLWKSSDGGDSFDQYRLLYGLADDLAGNRSYTRAFIQGDEIHLIAVRVGWSEPLDEHQIGRVEGVYYIKYDIHEEAFYRADGQPSFRLADAPVHGVQHFDKIWHWQEDGRGRQRAVWSDIVADDEGKPYAAFAVQHAVPQGESALHDGYWATPDEEGRWRHHKVATLARGWDNTPERKNYAIAIDPDDPQTVFVSKSISEQDNLSQVHRMHTTDGGETWKSNAMLSDEGRMTTVVVPWVVDQTRRTVNVLWLEGRMEGWRSFQTKVMMSRGD